MIVQLICSVSEQVDRNTQLFQHQCRYAVGDACANPSHPLPALAQVAEQQGRYLAAKLNYEV